MSLEELQECLRIAVAAFDNSQLYPGVRANAAFDILISISGHRDSVPAALRSRFEEMWGSFNAPGPRIEEIIKNQARFSLFSPDEIERCERLTRGFAQALDEYVASTAGDPAEMPLEAEEPPREENGRAAAEE